MTLKEGLGMVTQSGTSEYKVVYLRAVVLIFAREQTF